MPEKFMISPFQEEHELFRQQCRRFVEKELAPHAKEWEEKKDFPNEVFRRVGEMGYHGILIPEEYEIERFFRDTRINSIGGGTTEILKEVVGRMMGL